MKILWLVNIIMPELAKHLGHEPSVFAGWLIGARNAIHGSGNDLVICTTADNPSDIGKYEINGVTYYITLRTEIIVMQKAFRKILDEENPDVIHLYGTEFEHGVAMIREADPERTVVTIQGALVYYKDNVYSGIPEQICHDNLLHKTLRRLHKGGESIQLQKDLFEKRAVYELEVLEKAKYINGGSEWGNAVGRSVHPGCTTFDCRLILRDPFYCEERWSIKLCEKHSIYILYSYPIKGFHKFLEALRIVVRRYPDTKVYIVANKLPYRHYGMLKTWIMNHAQDYNWYVQNLIEEYGLKEHLNFLGYLSEEQVKERMLRSHVFVSASSIENQSTTLGEAMILGVPCVASCVGAIQEMICDGEDGFLYPFHEPYILANQILRIFDDSELAQKFSEKGHDHAAHTYDRKTNCDNLLKMYDTIQKNAQEKR